MQIGPIAVRVAPGARPHVVVCDDNGQMMPYAEPLPASLPQWAPSYNTVNHGCKVHGFAQQKFTLQAAWTFIRTLLVTPSLICSAKK